MFTEVLENTIICRKQLPDKDEEAILDLLSMNKLF